MNNTWLGNPFFNDLLTVQGLEVIESTNLKFFNKDMTAEFYALKGMFLSQLSMYTCVWCQIYIKFMQVVYFC